MPKNSMALESAKIRVLAIGNTDHPEFQNTAELLRSASDMRVYASVDHATNWLYSASLPPHWIVIFQSLPGQFGREMLNALWRLAPLARVVRVLGSWCEGEIRTGQPWPGAIRMYWHQAPARIRTELHLSALRGTAWPFPSTMTEEDRLLARTHAAGAEQHELVGIYTTTFSGAESLADACSARGWSTVWLQPGRPLLVRKMKACILDAQHSSDVEFAAIAKLRSQMPGVPIIALLSFPRLDDKNRAITAGASAVVSKPMLLDDLYQTLIEVANLGAHSAEQRRARA